METLPDGSLSVWLMDLVLPSDALRLRSSCRQARNALGSDAAAAAAFALTQPRLASVATTTWSLAAWMRVWGLCAEAVEAKGWEAGVWACAVQIEDDKDRFCQSPDGLEQALADILNHKVLSTDSHVSSILAMTCNFDFFSFKINAFFFSSLA